MPFGGMPGGFGGMGGGMGGMPGGTKFHFSTSGGNQGFQFSDPNDLFSSFFKSPGGAGGFDDNDIFTSAFGGGARGGSFGGRGDNGRGPKFQNPRPRQPTPEVTTVERPLPLTLEQLFKGATKKMKIKRKTFEEGGKRKMEDKICTVEIKPGYKAGTKIRFKGIGDQEEGGTQDLVFVVAEVC